MKKIAIILSVLTIVPAAANEYGYDGDDVEFYESYSSPDAEQYTENTAFVSDAPTTTYDNYAGIRLHKYEHIKYDYDIRHGSNYAMKDDNFGIGAFIGNRLTNHIKIEFETAYTGADFKKYNTDFEYDIWSNMLNLYLFKEYSHAVAPYIGTGIGFANIWANAAHNKDSEFNMSYQFMAGVNFALNNRIDLNLGVKYQNFGKMAHKSNSHTIAHTDIDATEIYLGAAYKFGI